MGRERTVAIGVVLTVVAAGVAGVAPGVPVRAAVRAAAPSEIHVEVVDFRFDPSTVRVPRGGTVVFDFVGPTHHPATDGSGLELYDSGPVDAGGPSTSFSFVAAGTYPFVCTPHAQMGGRVEVPVRAAPTSGGEHRRFTVTWAEAEASGGRVYDVQIRRPGATWTLWRRGVAAPDTSFVPHAGPGPYRFRARLRDTATRARSRWSPVERIRVV